MKYFYILLVCLSLGTWSCEETKNSGESATNNDTGSNNSVTPPEPSVGSVAIGGIPSAEELGDLSEFSLEDAESQAETLHSVTGSLAIEIEKDSSSTSSLNLNGDNCEDSFFCFAKAFSQIYDMVVNAASCNFDLLLHDNAKIKNIEGTPVFFTQGYGTVGIGDSGRSECPRLARVIQWARQNRIAEATEGETNETFTFGEEEFYIPSRLVMYKKPDGNLYWKVVFFPADMIQFLSNRVDFFKGLVDKDLDFVAFSGHHTASGEVGTGEGQVNLDFDEIARMIAILDDTQDSGGMPQGLIEINYDMSSDIQAFTTIFHNNFSFGDDEDGPISTGLPTTILKSANENYLYFQSNRPFVDPDEERDDGPTATAQRCGKSDPDNPSITIYDISNDDYLPTPSITHLQMIWSKIDSNETKPDNWIASITSTQGGPYIYGPVELSTAKIASEDTYVLRFKTPKCDDWLDPWADWDGFINFSSSQPFGSGSGSPTVISSEEMLDKYPDFSVFRIKDITDDDDTAIIADYVAAGGTTPTPPTYTATCLTTTEHGTHCAQYNDMTHLQYAYASTYLCGPFGENSTASFLLGNTCSSESVSHTCNNVTSFGQHTFEYDTDIYFYGFTDMMAGFFCKPESNMPTEFIYLNTDGILKN